MSASEHVEVLRAAHSSIYRILAELASGGQTDEQCEKELMQRPFVMDRVVRIRQALDKIGAALSAEPVGVGKCNGCGHIHPLGETGDALHKLQSLVDSHGDTGHENALDTLDGVIRRLAQPQHCPKCKFTMSGVGYCVNCQPQRQGEQWNIGFFDRWNEHAKKLGYAGMAEALTDLGEIKQRQGEAVEHEGDTCYPSDIYAGNSVGWWKSKADNYKNGLLKVCDALGRIGVRMDGNTPCWEYVEKLQAQQPASQGQAVVFAQLSVSDSSVDLCPITPGELPDKSIRQLLGNGIHNLYAVRPDRRAICEFHGLTDTWGAEAKCCRCNGPTSEEHQK